LCAKKNLDKFDSITQRIIKQNYSKITK